MSKLAHALRLFLAAVLIWAPVHANAGLLFDPAGTGKLRPGMRQGVPAAGPVAPAVTLNGLLMGWGDSREANGGGYAIAGQRLANNGYGILAAFTGNKLLYGNTGSYGVGASSSRNGRLRITSTNNSYPATVAAGGNSAGTDTGRAADFYWNRNASGEYTPLSDPANAVFFIYSTNDAGNSYFGGIAPTPLGSMQEISYQLDQFISANKFVFLANETPTRWAYREGEVQAVSSLAAQASMPAAQATPAFADKSLIALAPASVAGQVYTKVSSLTATGQYTVSASGAYAFFTGDPITSAQISYYYDGQGVSTAYRNTMHNWLQSASASPFVDPDSGISYPIAGALYGRQAYVESVDTWGATRDPATSGATTANLQGTSVDGLHPNAKANILAGNAFSYSFSHRFPALASRDKRPVANSFELGVGNGTATRFPSSGTTTLPQAAGTPSSLTAGKTAMVVGGVVSPVDVDQGNGTGIITGPGSAYTVTLNYATRAVFASFTTAPASNVYIQVAGDGGANYIANGLLDPGVSGGASPAVTGVSYAGASVIPKGWSITYDATVTAALNAGTFTVLIDSTGINPDTGFPEFKISYKGTLGGSAGAASTITLQNIARHPSTRVNGGASGDKLRAVAMTRVLPGPDGHVIGTALPQVRANFASSTSVTRPAPGTATAANQTTTATIMSAGIGGSLVAIAGDATDLGLSDDDVAASGGLKVPLCSPPVDASNSTPSNVYATVAVQMSQTKYVSGTVAISQVGLVNNATGQ